MKKSNLKIICIIAIVIIIDQVTKLLLINKKIEIISNILSFNYIKNTGGAFSIGENQTFFIIIATIIILAIVTAYTIIKKKQLKSISLISIALILAGGIGNLIDRIFRGYVIDFIEVKIFEFPNFNIADISIVIGIALFSTIYTRNSIKLKS